MLFRSALPICRLALEEDGSGMNEFYVECAMEGGGPLRELVRVAPLALSDRGLRVQNVEGGS